MKSIINPKNIKGIAILGNCTTYTFETRQHAEDAFADIVRQAKTNKSIYYYGRVDQKVIVHQKKPEPTVTYNVVTNHRRSNYQYFKN